MGKNKTQRKFSKGKSKKDTWKKLQHPDLEEFLRDQREDERLGLKEKADEELFVIDQLGSDSLAKAGTYQSRSTRSKSKDGPLVDFGSLRCFQILKSDSAVKDPAVKRNRVRLPGETKTVDMKLKDELRRYKKKSRTNHTEECDNNDDGFNDPWSTPVAKPVDSILSNEWLSEEAKRNLVRNRSGHVIKKPSTQIRSVEAPHPGLSINPSFTDHQSLLKQVVDITKDEIKKEQKLIRATAIPKDAKQEDVDGDEIKEEVEIKSEPESEDEDVKRGLLQPTAKTRQQKRKARELNEQQRSLKESKERLKREAEIFRIKTLKKDIQKAEKERKQKRSTKLDKELNRKTFGQLELSKHKFQPVKPEPKLSDEMAGSFLSDAQNSIAGLTLDRFKSLQQRNLIEPRVKQGMKRKYKLKKYQRPSEKMEWEVTGMWNGEKLLNPGDHRRRRAARGRKR